MKEVKLTLTRSIKKKSGAPQCNHMRVEVDTHERIVVCQDCGGKVDPFDYILVWANQESRFEMEVEYKKRELSKLYSEFEELKKNIQYVKRKGKTTRPVIIRNMEVSQNGIVK